MTGIVERLRGWNKDSYPHCWEAADEIERLQSCLYAQESVPALYAEIERLRAALQLIRDDAMSPASEPRDLWIEEVARRALEPKP